MDWIHIELGKNTNNVTDVWASVHGEVDQLSNQLEVNRVQVWDLRVWHGRITKWVTGVSWQDCNP